MPSAFGRFIRSLLGRQTSGRKETNSVRDVQKVDVQQKPRSPIDLVHDDAIRDSYETFKEHMKDAMLFPQKGRMRQYCLDLALKNIGKDGLYLEFGVFRGDGLNAFAKKLARHGLTVTGFDSLRGLQEDWTGNHNGREAGAYSVGGKAPFLEPNARLNAGWIQDTLPAFLANLSDEKIAFAHMDFDTYTPTAFALGLIKPRLVPGSIILFDELYGYPGWRNHEFRALIENLPSVKYKYISFSREAVGIEILSDI